MYIVSSCLFIQSLDGIFKSDNLPTANYCAVLDHRGEMNFGVGDMSVNDLITVNWVCVHVHYY